MEENLPDPTFNPTLSGMDSLLEEFSLVMFRRTHCAKSEFGHIHISHGCRLILFPNIFILWYAGILYSGGKSRPLVEADDIGKAVTLSPNVPSSANGRDGHIGPDK